MTEDAKIRLDALLVERGLAVDLKEAQALLLGGAVKGIDTKLAHAGALISRDAHLDVQRRSEWASRGALKLLGAFDVFDSLARCVEGASCIDVGAAHGGFTDVLLRRGAARVAAVDVGYGQLVWRLRQDPRVLVLERTNFKLLGEGAVPWESDVITCDASFIGLSRLLPVIVRELRPGGVFVGLVKPQFELAREDVPAGGVVRDDGLRAKAVEKVASKAEALGLEVLDTTPSPVHGPKGNQEILLLCRKRD